MAELKSFYCNYVSNYYRHTGFILIVILVSFISFAQPYNTTVPVFNKFKENKPKAVKAGILYTFRNYGIEEGLVQSQVVSMYEDSKGNIWFGTYGGVCKYDGATFKHFTTKNGLGDNIVSSILEDRSGNIWFGTFRGGVSRLNRDGRTFTHFTTKEPCPIKHEHKCIRGLCHNTVWSITEDKPGNLWFGTNEGVCKYNGEEFTHFTAKEPCTITGEHKCIGGLSGNIVMKIAEDKSGNLWFGTYSGLNKYDGKSFTYFTTKEGLSHNRVLSILEDKSGNLWFGTYGGGVNKYDPSAALRTGGEAFTHFTTKEGLSHNNVWSILEDKSGNLWFGTNEGVNKYDPSATLRTGGEAFTHFTTEEGLTHNHVYSILEDKPGNLWFGTFGGGADKYDGEAFTHYTTKEGLSNSSVTGILEDKSGNLWFGTDGGGVNKYDGESFTHFTTKEGLSNNNVLSILEDKSGNLWFGTHEGGVNKYDGKAFLHFTTKEGLSHNSVWSILEDKSGNLWFGTFLGGVNKYDGKTFTHFTTSEGLSHNSVWNILEDKSGNLWFGTYGGGINKYDGESFTHFTTNEGLSNNQVIGLLEDKMGNIWVGTYGGGVCVISPEYEWVYITTEDGLADDGVVSLVFDREGYVWAGTNKGISRIDPRILDKEAKSSLLASGKGAGLVRSYAKIDGFEGIGCNINASYSDSKGNLWFGSSIQLTKYDPKTDWMNKSEPQTHIKGARLFFDEAEWYPLPENLILPYDKNHLTFEFIGISLKVPEKVRYQFMLEGLDKNWSPVTAKREATYSNIPAGEYTFKVKAANDEGLWNEEAVTYSFVITPPWWETTLFRISCLVFVLFCIWAFIKIRERKLKAQKRILEDKVQLRTRQLQEKNEDLEQANVEITNQKEVIEEKSIQLKIALKDVTDSIRYAQNIQQAILPPIEYIKKALPNSFVLFKPKDIVSGDFYFFAEIPHPGPLLKKGEGEPALGPPTIVLAACDCTGHGVPGAFMSMIGSQLLNEIVNEKSITDAAEVLNQLKKGIIHAFGEAGETGEQKDGMDMAMCCLTPNPSPNGEGNWTLQYAGANNPLYIVRNNNKTELVIVKPDKQPVGYNFGIDHPFTSHNIKFQKGDTFYITSDGYQDQFGGPRGKKFMSKRLRQLFTDIQTMNMEEQKKHLDKTIEGWKDNRVQVDDILVIGVRV